MQVYALYSPTPALMTRGLLDGADALRGNP